MQKSYRHMKKYITSLGKRDTDIWKTASLLWAKEIQTDENPHLFLLQKRHRHMKNCITSLGKRVTDIWKSTSLPWAKEIRLLLWLYRHMKFYRTPYLSRFFPQFTTKYRALLRKTTCKVWAILWIFATRWRWIVRVYIDTHTHTHTPTWLLHTSLRSSCVDSDTGRSLMRKD